MDSSKQQTRQNDAKNTKPGCRRPFRRPKRMKLLRMCMRRQGSGPYQQSIPTTRVVFSFDVGRTGGSKAFEAVSVRPRIQFTTTWLLGAASSLLPASFRLGARVGGLAKHLAGHSYVTKVLPIFAVQNLNPVRPSWTSRIHKPCTLVMEARGIRSPESQ